MQTRNLSAGYDLPVLADVNLELPMGVWWTLLGPNGCGKTTLLDTLAGRLPALSGEVRIDGHAMQDKPISAKRALGYALPPYRLPDRLTGR
ncbi:MAG: ATP-binding cassette domain-containing protein, partial [Pseudomonadota bacterium]